VPKLPVKRKTSIRRRLGAGICIDKRNPVIENQRIGLPKI
jgi:hypothetical protein